MKRHTIAGLLWLSFAGLPALKAGDVYKPPNREPTAKETLILEYMNRYRAAPKEEADLILAEAKNNSSWIFRGVDMEMFKKEMYELKPQPPLVFNLELLDAARKHSYYMILNGLGHDQQDGKPGFTGKSFVTRAKASGYQGSPGGENCFASAPSPLGSHIGFIVDTGAGPGGMQPGRGHRKNMIGGFREVGCSAVEHSEAGKSNARGGTPISVTHVFGNSRTPRLAGGVVYIDKNRNGFYDEGEGVGGVTISGSDGSSTRTWASGAYTLELKSAQNVTLTAKHHDGTFNKTYEAGKDNLKFDWVMPQELDLKKADQLLAKVDASGDLSAPAGLGAVLELYVGTRNMSLDPARQEKIERLTAHAGPAWDKASKTILQALSNFKPTQWNKLLAEQREPYRKTSIDAWFKEADKVATATASLENFEAGLKQKNVPGTMKNQFIQSLEQTEKSLQFEDLKTLMSSVVAQAKVLANPTAPTHSQGTQGRPNGRR